VIESKYIVNGIFTKRFSSISLLSHKGINTLAYVLCCLPAAFSQLVKERAIQ